jgi:hypothetical protein
VKGRSSARHGLLEVPVPAEAAWPAGITRC